MTGESNTTYTLALRKAGAQVIRVRPGEPYKSPRMEFTPYKYTKTVNVAEELLNDTRYSTESLILEDVCRAFSQIEDDKFVNSSGIGEPQGVLIGGTLGMSSRSSNVITYNDISKLRYSLAENYRNNASWMMNKATFRAISNLRGRDNDLIWSPDIEYKHFALMMGRPVIINESMPNIAAGSKPIVFGDMSHYWIVEFGEMTVKRLDDLAKNLVVYEWATCLDGRVMIPDAIKYLVMGSEPKET